jgi:hypothetical protein
MDSFEATTLPERNTTTKTMRRKLLEEMTVEVNIKKR